MTNPAPLAETKNALAQQYRQLIAEVKASPDTATPALLGKTLVSAVCANDQENAVHLAQRLVPGIPALPPLRLSPLATLAAYCRDRGLPYEQVLAPLHVELPGPLVYDTEPAAFASVPRAQYIPGWDYVIGEDDTILEDTGYMPLDVATKAFVTLGVRSLNSLVHYLPAEERFIDEEVLFLSAPVNNVGHWMIDFLPRMRGLALLAGRKIRLAVPADMPARYTELLRAFAISDGDIIACAPLVRYRFRVCHLYKPGRASLPNPVHVRFVREHLTGGEALKIRRGKRVYLARARIGTRQVANRAPFEALLAQHGFITADLADLDFASQKDLLGDAEIILGPFGSNLFGMYLAPAACSVITMMSDAWDDMAFGATAALLGQRHEYFMCENAPEGGLKLHKKDRDIIVDCAALARRIADIERT